MRWPLVVVIALILMSSSNQVIIGVGTPSAEHVKVTSSPLFAVLSSGFRTIVGFTETRTMQLFVRLKLTNTMHKARSEKSNQNSSHIAHGNIPLYQQNGTSQKNFRFSNKKFPDVS